MFSKIKQYVGKADRELGLSREREKRRQNIYPKNDLEAAISDSSQEIRDVIKRGGKLTIDQAFNLYMNARSNRHDIWVNYLITCRSKPYFTFNDTLVKDFHNEFTKEYPCRDLPENLSRLTPDILIYDRESATIYIGDVACTNSVRDADRRKYNKYKPLVTFYELNNYKVKHQNFIIDSRLHNINQAIRDMENSNLIMPVDGVKTRSIHYFKVAANIMEECINYCEDKVVLTNMIKKADKQEDDTYDQIVLPDNIDWPELKSSEPKKPEMVIINEIKEYVEKMPDTYFDKNINNTVLKLDEIKEINKDREHMQPKSTLKVCSNQTEVEALTDHQLILDYLSDICLSDNTEVSDYVKWLLPSGKQIDTMKYLKQSKSDPSPQDKANGVHGHYQYNIPRHNSDNLLINDAIKKLTYGKASKNDKEVPRSIDPDRYPEMFSDVEKMIAYYGSMSDKPPFVDDTWDAATQFESDSSEDMRRLYNLVASTNGVQLAHSLSNFYQRLCHLKTSLSVRDNIYIPPNGSFIAIIPKDHAPFTSASCDVPLIFISRISNECADYQEIINGNEHEYIIKTDKYTYMVSKLCRLSLNKMANWDQAGYRLLAIATYLCSLNLTVNPMRVVGILTFMMLDVHQKTSELLDLLKYVAFMPFSDITRLSSLVEDKFNIMFKTRLDIWTLINLEHMIVELSDIQKLNAKKPKLQLHNGVAIHESFGMNLELPSIFDLKQRHKSPDAYIEEISAIYTVRGKQLYGSQFMDKSIFQTAKWEDEYNEEIKIHNKWVIDGDGEGAYPFDSKFAFHSDAILYAIKTFNERSMVNKGKVMRDLTKGPYNDFLHYNCSLRGCVKEAEDRSKPSDIHTTSLEACLLEYEKKSFESEKCTSNEMAYDFIRSGRRMEFSMSEKEQRGGGRPIATPTVRTKAALMMLEKPEASIGKQVKNNVIVPGKNKLQEQCETYKSFITHASLEGYKYVYQITEDQTKFSEMDNPRKFIPYINNNELLDDNVKRIQLKVVEKLCDREHLVKRMPNQVTNTNLSQYLNYQGNGIRTTIGWPQGMCNFISTSIHMIADYWITDAYNKAYPNNQVRTSGLVHSDDSWVVIAANCTEDFERFCKFRIVAKKLFCLKMNEKKLWGSRYLGELVSNYNINGNVHLCVSKTIANAFTGLTYQNWMIDVHNQISALQQCYRQGGNIPTLIMMSTILRQQIFSSYHIDGYQKVHLHELPIELGGYPTNSVFELAVNGVNCYYRTILNNVKKDPNNEISLIILRCLRLSIIYMGLNDKKEFLNEVYPKLRLTSEDANIVMDGEDEQKLEVDYESIHLPYRGDVFMCIKHLMPQSTKVKKTIKRIRNLPFSGDGLELLVTRPKELKDALGHLKDQTSTALYTLAAEKYTQSARRLAISQTLQSSGKTVRLVGLAPMTYNQLLKFLSERNHIPPATIAQLESAFTDSNPMPDTSHNIVYNSDHEFGTVDKRKIINRLPDIDDNFKTLVPIKDILLYIIDGTYNTKYYELYCSQKTALQLVVEGETMIKRRFCTYFNAYPVKIACNLIMKLYMENKKTRLWMQPYLNQENVTVFLEDLYGKTINSSINYRIKCIAGYNYEKNQDSEVVRSLYTCAVLDSLYPGSFEVQYIKEKYIDSIIETIDYAKLSLDDLLKLAIVIYYKYADNRLLKLYDQSKLFSKKYIKPQTYINGRYVGKFIADVKYGTTIFRIDGEPGDLTISVNKLNMNELLMGMMLFINDSFPTERYSHPSLWHTCSVWNSKYKIGSLFLTAYTQSASHFTTSSIINSIPLFRNENLRYDDMYVDYEDYDYVVEDNLRTVYKIREDKKIRVGNVKQNLSCPLAKHIICADKLVDGISNNELLNTKVIINLTMRKAFSNSKKDIESLLKKCLFINNGLLPIFYKNIIATFTNNVTPRDYAHMEPLEIVDDIMMTGYDATTYLTKHDETTADDLTHMETNFLYEETEEVNAMVKYNNIVKYLCQCYMINLTEDDRDGIIQGLIKDHSIMKKIASDANDPDIDELLDGMIEVGYEEQTDLNMETITFIIANDFDLSTGFDKINIRKLLSKTTKRIDLSMHASIILNNIKADLDKHIFDDEYRDAENRLMSMLDNK